MIAENLKKVRITLGLSVARFADKLEMSANTITNYEQKRREPSAVLFVQLNKKANVNLNWLVTGEGEMFNQPQIDIDNEVLEQKVVEVMKKYGVIEHGVGTRGQND